MDLLAIHFTVIADIWTITRSDVVYETDGEIKKIREAFYTLTGDFLGIPEVYLGNKKLPIVSHTATSLVVKVGSDDMQSMTKQNLRVLIANKPMSRGTASLKVDLFTMPSVVTGSFEAIQRFLTILLYAQINLFSRISTMGTGEAIGSVVSSAIDNAFDIWKRTSTATDPAEVITDVSIDEINITDNTIEISISFEFLNGRTFGFSLTG
jgi:hypothetical protein